MFDHLCSPFEVFAVSTQAERDERAAHRRAEDLVHIQDEDAWADFPELRMVRDTGAKRETGRLQSYHRDWGYMLYVLGQLNRVTSNTPYLTYDTAEAMIADGWRIQH